ncbi:MAG: Glucose-methanol-choline (GMC) oxidoreductase:NAD binding site [uncultured Sulfurovum sp.]|uniref:Glucose-methanol-choline (GMC) oxidoreductase:NAD binding site n=1 Tax=uncultured Sulfurovum sp. TaxID=269237 RepID=A0A6S6TC62_9BACT|nr:MAG: Glucose-methanol-choline (GMC) oxidoreductase:NAD binding site [uncultured Sulfurovum sp.]
MYDVAVIGSGASGGAVAYTLCKAGYNVVMFEKGRLIGRDEFSKDELAYSRRDLITPNLFDEYHTIEEKIDGEWKATPTYESGWSFWNGSIVGGSSNLMSGMVHRLHPDDFRLKSKYGDIEGSNIVDWPIGYEDLEPYYDRVEELVGISGDHKDHPYEPWRSRVNFTQPATQENAVVKLFDKSCHALNIVPLVTPRAVLSKDKEDRKACYYSNFCGSYGCSSGAKGSSREALIKPALATGKLKLMTNTHVKSLKSNKEGKVTFARVVNTITGKEKEISATIFVVAAQAHESARLLLNSANKYYPNGLANSSGELGKNLLFSGGGSGQGELHKDSLKEIKFNELMTTGLFVNRSILDWYFIDHWWYGKFKGGSVEFMFEHQNIISRARKNGYSEGKLVWGEALGERIVKRFTEQKSIRFEIFNDWLPNDNCFVALDETHKDKYGMPVGKLRLEGHPQDVKVGKYIAKKCEKLLEEMGAKNIYSSISSSAAQNLVAGGCRFGNDPKTSVLNKYCQAHDVENLYVADASFMPTGGSVAYTWTIYANAFRVADHIVKVLDKG